MTDVNIAVELMTDAFQDRFDVALLITADSDLVGPINAVQKLFGAKKIVVAFPPNRVSKALKGCAHGSLFIGRNTLAKCQFPREVVKPNGFVLRRPKEWR